MKCNYKIEGIDCADCAAELERKINKVKGVNSATISFITEKMSVEVDENEKDSVIKDVKKLIKKEEPDVTIEEI